MEVTADVPVTLAAGAVHVSPAGDPATEQEMFTCPVKPPEGVTVSVVVLLLPAVTVTEPLLARPKPGAAFTVIGTAADCVILPVAASDAVTVAV